MHDRDPLETVVIYAAVFGIAIGAACWQAYLEKKRTAALRALARRLGLDFKERDYLSTEVWAHCPLFQEGHDHEFKNVMRGTPEGTHGLLLCDFQYVTGSGRNKSTHKQTMAVLDYPKGGLSAFSLRPENLLLKIATLFGYQDIDFKEDPGFSKLYLLRGPDEAALRSLFGLNLREYFKNHPGWFLEGNRSSLVACRHGQRIKPQDIPGFVDELKLLLWAFPR
jgi:hypothetical protein